MSPTGQIFGSGAGTPSVDVIAVDEAPVSGTYSVIVKSSTGQGGAWHDGAGSYRLTLE